MSAPVWFRALTRNLKGDLYGGVTTGIVALPLALALGVASGAGAAAGLWSAIITGALAGIFGGAPAQVSGPTAAMTAVLVEVYQTLGLNGLFAAMFLCGAIQLGLAALRLGKYIHFIPRPVIVGFTNGIAVLIFWKQLVDFLPGHRFSSLASVAVGFGVFGLMLIWPRITRKVPGSLVAVVLATLAVTLGKLDVPQIGELPKGLPALHLPAFALAELPSILKAAVMLALLGVIESLLAAVVVDELAGTRHKPDQEIVGQGIANVVAPLFGGLAGTGAIVRSAVNVRAGGRTPLAALLHSLLILAFTLGLRPVAAVIPLPALWGVLLATAFGMFEWGSLRDLVRAPYSDSIVMVVTCFLTVYEDLVIGVAVGLVASMVLFTSRMTRLPVAREIHGQAVLLRLEGPLFFGLTHQFISAVESVPVEQPQVWDLSRVPSVDATGADMLKKAWRKAQSEGRTVYLAGLQPACQQVLERLEALQGFPAAQIVASAEAALACCRGANEPDTAVSPRPATA